jgi:hypothetical protein
LGTGLESKSSDLDVFEPGGSATAPFPNLKIWTPVPFLNLKIWTPVPFPKLKSWTPVPFPKLKSWTPADTFIVPENSCFRTYEVEHLKQLGKGGIRDGEVYLVAALTLAIKNQYHWYGQSI